MRDTKPRFSEAVGEGIDRDSEDERHSRIGRLPFPPSEWDANNHERYVT